MMAQKPRGRVTEREEEVALATPGGTLAALGAAIVAAALVVLSVLVGLGAAMTW